ncbi:putative phage abortive infection protein [Sphingomonas echinoides]|uniref:putative phage abortive infection protein n=1 Tax=Sphingomonas echinoides TaxID=59803 RepID=UPI0024134519|nr:putative phage abortive infection protein [Sphingomonas echinoides]
MRTFGILAFAATVLIALWTFWALDGVDIAAWWLDHRALTIQEAGSWGDSFGAFNALVSTFGSAAVLATLWLQTKSLNDQARDTHRQRFESSFFELLRLVREVRSEITYSYSVEYIEMSNITKSVFGTDKEPISRTYRGHEAIRSAVVELRYWVAPGRSARTKDSLIKIYEQRIPGSNEASLGPYFRLIYTILHRVSFDKYLLQNEKNEYGNLLRSQLTSEELSLIAVNSLAPFAKGLADLIREFRLLKYLPPSSLRRRLVPLLGDEAFASRD